MAKTNPTSRAHALATHDWRSMQPAHQGADGLPNARGQYVLRCIDGEWHLLGPGESSEAVGNDIIAARARMEEAHAAYIAGLPAPAVRQVYFIGSSAKIGLPVKIGVSDRPETRLRQLQIASAAKLSILAVVEGDELAEALYHTRFRTQQLHGEWFEIDRGILREIERLAR
jgi:hypothetical protein